MTISELVRQTAEALRRAGIESAPRDARDLVALALGEAPGRLILRMEEKAGPDALQVLADILPDRLARKPLSHITRRRAFWRHDFTVTPDVLDPRPETETLVAEALQGSWERVLDLGTGSGCIVLSLLAERAAAHGLGIDLSPASLAIAEANGRRLGLANRVEWRLSDWFGAVPERFDLIVSNPPYIGVHEMGALAPELAHEPRMALTDEADGLGAYRVLTADAAAHLVPGGRLLVEIGWRQAEAVRALFTAAGFARVCVLRDLDGRDRVVSGYLRG